MPNYEYQCTACPNLFEIWQPVGEAAPPCPECGEVVKKVFRAPRVIFKGSGFYVTDLRAEKASSSSKSSAKSEATSSDSLSDSAAPASSSKKNDSANNSATASKPSVASGESANSSSDATSKPANSAA